MVFTIVQRFRENLPKLITVLLARLKLLSFLAYYLISFPDQLRLISDSWLLSPKDFLYLSFIRSFNLSYAVVKVQFPPGSVPATAALLRWRRLFRDSLNIIPFLKGEVKRFLQSF